MEQLNLEVPVHNMVYQHLKDNLQNNGTKANFDNFGNKL